MILEGIVTTLNDDGSVNISPMGPMVDVDMRRVVLRPFNTSTTYKNLRRSRQGVLHVTDDVLLLAQAAVGEVQPPPKMHVATSVVGFILTDACRWYAFEVRELDDRQERTRIECEVVDGGRQRDFFGFNRGKHAVLEAAILATRLHLLPREEVLSELDRLQILIDKTGGEQEHTAFDFLRRFVDAAESI